jgi:2-haloacid dehalogenase
MAIADNHRRAIVFDFGGVLIDWDPRHLYRKLLKGDEEAVEHFLNDIGFDVWNLELDRGRSFAEGVADLSRQFPQYAEMIRAYDLRWEESIGGPIQSTVDILHALKHAGYPLFGLSNCPQEKYLVIRAKFPFFDLLDDSIISGDVKLLKPDLQIFRLLLERIGRTAKDCVFVDDSEENAAAARQLGMDTIHYKSSKQLESELVGLGVLNRD